MSEKSDPVGALLMFFALAFMTIGAIGILVIITAMITGAGVSHRDICEFRNWGVCAGK